MRRLEFKLLSLKRHHFVLVFTGAAIGAMLVMAIAIELLGIGPAERKDIEWSFWLLFSALILAPTLETLIFQKWPIDFLEYRFGRKWPLILISATPFGLGHYLVDYLVRDIFYSFILGVIFAYAYVLGKKHKNLNPYLVVVLIHGGYNLWVVIIQWIAA